MTPTDRIRDIQPGDLGWIICQHGLIYSEEFGFNQRFEFDIVAKMQALLARRDDFSRFWMYEVAGERAGSLVVSEKAPGVAFINFVIVPPRFRNRGIALELLQQALAHCREHGYPRVRLETFDCLQQARRLYARLGFTLAEATSGYAVYGPSVQREFWELALAPG